MGLSFGKSGFGIITTCIPAVRAAATPLGESSNTKTYNHKKYVYNNSRTCNS